MSSFILFSPDSLYVVFVKDSSDLLLVFYSMYSPSFGVWLPSYFPVAAVSFKQWKTENKCRFSLDFCPDLDLFSVPVSVCVFDINLPVLPPPLSHKSVLSFIWEVAAVTWAASCLIASDWQTTDLPLFCPPCSHVYLPMWSRPVKCKCGRSSSSMSPVPYSVIKSHTWGVLLLQWIK